MNPYICMKKWNVFVTAIMHKLMDYIVKIRQMIDKNQYSGVEVISKGKMTLIEKIQWLDLYIAPTKIEDTLVETQDPFEEINLRANEEPRVTYLSNLLLTDLK